MLKNMFDDAKELAERDVTLLETWEDKYGIRYDITIIEPKGLGRMPGLASLIGTSWFCGYATFPKRPFSKKGYNDEPACNVAVHGGITFAEPVNPKKPAGVYTYGFDTAHAGDCTHGWTQKKVKEELVSMVVQIMRKAER